MPCHWLERLRLYRWRYLHVKVRGKNTSRPIQDSSVSKTPKWLKWHCRLSSRRTSPLVCSKHPTRWDINLRLFLAFYIHILINQICLIITSGLHHERIWPEWPTRLLFSLIIPRRIKTIFLHSSKVHLSRGFIPLIRLILELWRTLVMTTIFRW